MTQFTLYHTPGCHLCEEAEALVSRCLPGLGVSSENLTLADIAPDEALFERYGWVIPVLRCHASGLELNWPFDLEQVRLFMAASLGADHAGQTGNTPSQTNPNS